MPPVFTRPEFAARRRALRAAATPAEALLWGALRRKRLDGRKFRRQHGIGPYVVEAVRAAFGGAPPEGR